MTSEEGRLRRTWDDLTGASTRWRRTIPLAAVIGKLSLALSALAILAVTGEASLAGFSGVLENLSAAVVFAAVVAAPLLESLCVVALVWIFAGRFHWSAAQTAAVVGVCAVPFHGLALVSFSVLPFFALFGLIQFHWRARGQAWTGFWIISAVHALANGASVLLLWAFPDL